MSHDDLPIDEVLARGARVMWVAAHPDDEFLSGALLARASVHYGNPLRIVLLTRGEGGAGAEGDGPSLGDVRAREMAAVADRLHAELQLESFWNAPLPESSFPRRDELYARWREEGDPVAVVTRAVRSFRPDVLLTFEPTHGATGHPEHQLASRIATAAVREAAETPRGADAEAAHRVERVYYVLERHWFFRLLRGADPGPTTETWDGRLPCGDTGGSCMDFLVDLTRLHETQAKDMGAFRAARRLFTTVHLRRVDPWSDVRPPDEAP
ncbi:MAG: PIG-L deacetylase family protein [Myxococcota bacterium]